MTRAPRLPLFEEDDAQEPSSPAPAPWEAPELHALAARLPDGVRCGTSSWSFPGWRGIVYRADASAQTLAREGLREYARHPLLRTVGIDRSYYAPIPEADLRRYAAQLPPGFPCCLKAPAAVTSMFVPETGVPGGRTRNPAFLSADLLVAELVEPCLRAFAGHVGAIILEFPPVAPGLRPDPVEFVERLDACLAALPRDVRYAVELRDRRLLTPAYRDVLVRHGAAHVFNYWTAMPMPAAQAAVVPVERLPFIVIRLLLAPGTRYEDQRERYRPFDRLVDPAPGMRADVLHLLDRAIRARQPAFLLVNNKAEGSAPLTIRAILEQLVDRRGVTGT